MISKVTIKVAWYDLGKKGTRVEIFPGNVENVVGDGMPLPMYMAILKAMMQVENDFNGKAAPTVEPTTPKPNVSGIEEMKKMGEAWAQMGRDMLREEQADSPPP